MDFKINFDWIYRKVGFLDNMQKVGFLDKSGLICGFSILIILISYLKNLMVFINESITVLRIGVLFANKN